jgi:ATP-dependent DNA helicase RecG
MIDEAALRKIMTDLESDRIERTSSYKDTDKLGEAICAFSNDLPNHKQPGYFLIGVNDDGSLSGISVDDELLKKVGGIRSEGNVLPIPTIHVTRVQPEGGDVAVIEVQPSPHPPVRYKGRTWIRVGPRKAIATEAEERSLSEKRVSHALSFDNRPCLDSSIEDLSLDLFFVYRNSAIAPEIVKENHRPIEQQLSSLRLFHQSSGSATNAGIILLGKNPLFFLPGAYIQFLKVAGCRLGDDIVEDSQVSGDLQTVLRRLDDLVNLQIVRFPFRTSPLTEGMSASYPEIAVRELLLNAVLHRNYESSAPIRFYWFEDRIEIQSPGGLYGEATKANFPQANSYRNPVVAEIMRELGYVNRYGRGVYRAQQALSKNGNREAEFEFTDEYVLVKIFRS